LQRRDHLVEGGLQAVERVDLAQEGGPAGHVVGLQEALQRQLVRDAGVDRGATVFGNRRRSHSPAIEATAIPRTDRLTQRRGDAEKEACASLLWLRFVCCV